VGAGMTYDADEDVNHLVNSLLKRVSGRRRVVSMRFPRIGEQINGYPKRTNNRGRR
jgi:hypothetical protein